jgi:hypothetical protein
MLHLFYEENNSAVTQETKYHCWLLASGASRGGPRTQQIVARARQRKLSRVRQSNRNAPADNNDAFFSFPVGKTTLQQFLLTQYTQKLFPITKLQKFSRQLF